MAVHGQKLRDPVTVHRRHHSHVHLGGLHHFLVHHKLWQSLEQS
uniref:Uncharacterized protein n=1 Tax=Anguilla anguilla TaxID=7936 RepID=A0A0E9W731_ANGAN